MNPAQLLAYFHRISEAPDAIPRLRRFILDLAVRGKLGEQDPKDEPASELLKRILAEKARLVKEGRIKGQDPLPPLKEGEIPFKLPSSWAWIRVGEGFLYDAGTKREPKELELGLWLLELEDIEKDMGVVLTRLKVSDRDSHSTKSEFKAGDILYGKLRPYLNKVVVATERGYSTTEIVAIRSVVPLCSSYCCIAFRRSDFVAYVNRLGQGTKMPRLRTPDALVALFPLPPIPEQHRIVAKVDELMALCDQLEAVQAERESRRDRLVAASLQRLSQPAGEDGSAVREHVRFHLRHLPRLTTRPEQIQQLRKTILNFAVRGKLVPQDSNDETASELLKYIQAEKARLIKQGSLKKDKPAWEGLPKEPPHQLPSNWIWARLQDVFEVSRGGSPRPAGDPRYFGGPIPWITVREITKDGEKYLTKTEGGLTEEGAKRSRFINPGDLLLTNSGATLGVPKVSRIRACMNDGVAVLRLFHSVALNDFAYLYLHSQTNAFRKVNQGMGQPNLNTPIIAGWFFPLPPLAEQRRIVAKVEELLALCDRLEAQLTTAQTESRRLLEAVLREALAVA
ncbi:MAG TPA: restriction endonuclease subunit S [Thermoanaerobaculia bacterium]